MEASKYKADVRFLPYEMFLGFWIKRQKLLVILEAELWYMLIVVAAFKGTKIVLLNARISEKSVKKYLQFAWFYKKMLWHVDMIYAQSEADKNRFLALGARNIEVIGNIKLAATITKTKEYKKPKEECIVAGSTHEGEEESVLKSFVEYKKQHKAKLIVVPRHPERFESVYVLMKTYAEKHSMTLSKFSQSENFDAEMILVDVMGELNNIYAISDIAILGCKIITGKHFFHQKELFKYVHHVQYVAPSEIHKALLACRSLPGSIVEEKINLESVIKKIVEL